MWSAVYSVPLLFPACFCFVPHDVFVVPQTGNIARMRVPQCGIIASFGIPQCGNIAGFGVPQSGNTDGFRVPQSGNIAGFRVPQCGNTATFSAACSTSNSTFEAYLKLKSNWNLVFTIFSMVSKARSFIYEKIPNQDWVPLSVQAQSRSTCLQG